MFKQELFHTCIQIEGNPQILDFTASDYLFISLFKSLILSVIVKHFANTNITNFFVKKKILENKITAGYLWNIICPKRSKYRRDLSYKKLVWWKKKEWCQKRLLKKVFRFFYMSIIWKKYISAKTVISFKNYFLSTILVI